MQMMNSTCYRKVAHSMLNVLFALLATIGTLPLLLGTIGTLPLLLATNDVIRPWSNLTGICVHGMQSQHGSFPVSCPFDTLAY